MARFEPEASSPFDLFCFSPWGTSMESVSTVESVQYSGRCLVLWGMFSTVEDAHNLSTVEIV